MNSKYHSILKKLLLTSPSNRDLYLRKRKTRIRNIIHDLGLHKNQTPTIHVVGTKGKGSTAAFISSILKESNYNTGLFTSPHLSKITERIRINLKPITQKDFYIAFNKTWQKIKSKQTKLLGGTSFFEAIMIIALWHFKNKKTNIQIIEAGIGGENDSTNYINPILTVITNISLDHQKILGNTIEKISLNKSGAIKKNIPIILAPQTKNVLKIFQNKAKQAKASLSYVPQLIQINSRKTTLINQSFTATTPINEYKIKTSLLGRHQIENISLSILAAEMLIQNNYKISKENIEKGIAKAAWPGRLQIIKKHTNSYFIDSAHNWHSTNQLIKSLKEIQNTKFILIFGASSGHSYKKSVNSLASISKKIYFVKSRHPKAIPTSDLINSIDEKKITYHQCSDVKSALVKLHNKNENILIAGSVAIAGEALEYLNNITPELYPYL
tara:strand:+ start:2786 stop:4108 length:1323 start_codon:yes stop_codon:yes gene_type:complete